MSKENEAMESYGSPVVITDGPFAGWSTWGFGSDPFETVVGPFCFKQEQPGCVRAAFQPVRQHLNGAGAVHGGALMSFADFALFAIARDAIKDLPGVVTLTMNSEFIAAGGLQGWIEAEGEVLKETGSLVFVRGLLKQNGKTLFAFSGTLKKLFVSNRTPR